MVTKRMRSEYMKKFKDPKWETYSRCYEEMLKYRLTRRLLEHTHNPWFWSAPDSDSDSGGRTPPAPSNNQVRGESSRDRPEAAELEECEGARMDRQLEQQSRVPGSVPRLLLPEEDLSAVNGSLLESARESEVPEEEREEQTHREQDRERVNGGPRPQQSKLSKSSKQIWRSHRVRPAPTRQPRDDSKERRHPFALYGSGEKDADMASRKTHNVGPEASTTEIHESALRAKTRRKVERQIQTQGTERRRAKSANLDKATKSVQPEFNPWLTEYMRCFSARSR
ncbi:centriole, cilia and spindle-associated protein [Cottoperca gobio]|uniref:Centriole, cilia and spindle-associated protein n=1 Tax=Cottoperca gobio TaxID=56716 RepID=A0A6J2RKN7_COTGO|nr:centriole, cilia and spindle-associated protein [Cottoperca gobio]XP_029310520.1 centriole, cilia and spindle-associated protein [Cottoperca gobio]XP_029310529.1 centriole, cilia and spindle-associated protein [Cottoperca gobio]